MTCSPITVRRLLRRLPEPRRATLADVGHAAAMAARGRCSAPGGELAALLAELDDWRDRADRSRRP